MAAVPIVGRMNGRPDDASRPPGEWKRYYCPYRGCLAPPLVDVRVWREGWKTPIRRSQLQPTSNVYDLFWQPDT